MKRNIAAFLVLAFSSVMILSSCKKKTNTLAIEYRIAPIDNAITKITYNDATGAPIEITNPAQFGNGSTIVTITAIPYTAKISIEVNNQTVISKSYDLAIFVGGQLMKLESGVALPMTTSTVISAEYIVQ